MSIGICRKMYYNYSRKQIGKGEFFVKPLFLFISLLAASLPAAGGDRHVSPLPTGELADKEGNPVFLMSTTIKYDSLQSWYRSREEFKGTYPPEYEWLYGRQTSVPMMLRCGFNALNFVGTEVAFRALAPEYAGFAKGDPWDDFTAMMKKYGWEKLRKIPSRQAYEEYVKLIASAKDIPVYLDLHTGMRFSALTQNREITGNLLDPARYLASQDQHPTFAVRFRLGTEEGRAALVKLYRHEAESMLAQGVRPFAYKLFNEANYRDNSPGNQRLFLAELKKRHSAIANLNRAWGTRFSSFDEVLKSDAKARDIEYKKFQERQVVQLAREMKAMLRELDPGALTLIQVHSGAWRQSWNNFNLCLLNREMDFISTGTGNYTFSPPERLEEVPFANAATPSMGLREYLGRAAFYRALADGKPLVTTEAYFPGIRERYQEFKKVLWHEIAHGSNLVNMWEWIGYWYPKQKTNRIAYGLHSQHVVSPPSWRALGEVSNEIAQVRDLFGFRKNRPAAQVACLYSYPTLRANQPLTEGFLQAVSGLTLRHIPVDAVLEEQLPEGRLNRYKMLIASGVRNIAPETTAELRKFVEAGGILVVAGGWLDRDEYDNPLAAPLFALPTVAGESKLRQLPGTNLDWIDSETFANAPAGWESVIAFGGKPLYLLRKQGKGKIAALAGSFRDNGFTELLLPLLAEAGAEPVARLRRAEGEEIPVNIGLHKATSGDQTGWYIVNYTGTPQQIRLSAPELQGKTAVAPFEKERYPVDGDTVTLLVPATYHRVIVTGPAATVEKRFGRFAEVGPPEIAKRLAAELEELEKKNAYVRPSKPVNIAKFANYGFDNQQGWATPSAWREGDRRDLPRVPFHGSVFQHLDFDIIRFDFNDNRTCIALKSKNLPEAPASVEGIPLGGKFRGVALLLSATHAKKGETALTLRFRYEDGSESEAPLVIGRDFGGWKIADNSPELQKACAWKTPAGYGFYLYEWNNPFPAKGIQTMSLLSGNGESVPIVVAVSALPTIYRNEYANRVDLVKFMEAKNAKEGNGWHEDGTFHKNRDTVGLTTIGGKPLPIPAEKLKDAVLRFQIKFGCDEWGKQMPVNGYLWPYLSGACKGKILQTNSPQTSRASTDLSGTMRPFRPDEWNEVELRLEPLLTVPEPNGELGTLESITGLTFGDNRTYPIFRDLRIEY